MDREPFGHGEHRHGEREDEQDESSIASTSSVFVVADTRKWVPFPLHRDGIVAIVVKRIFSYSSGAISFIV